MVNLREIVGKLVKLNLLRRIELNKTATDEGLYFGQLPIIEYIINNEGCTQKEIADRLGVTPASIAISTKRMQKAGLIEKRTDENNLRCNRLSATNNGIELARTCRERANDLDKRMFKGFSEQELDAIRNSIDRMIENISDGSDIRMDMYSITALKNEIERRKRKRKSQSNRKSQ
ncbi:MAG: MarR family transcriptional regulator [Clostridiaceae bacterium]|nr:MarR family transcriptional regulator [Clostridiaceae bacterium]